MYAVLAVAAVTCLVLVVGVVLVASLEGTLQTMGYPAVRIAKVPGGDSCGPFGWGCTPLYHTTYQLKNGTLVSIDETEGCVTLKVGANATLLYQGGNWYDVTVLCEV